MGGHQNKKQKVSANGGAGKKEASSGSHAAAKGNQKADAAAPAGKKLFEAVVTAPPRAGDAASTNWEKLKKIIGAGKGSKKHSVSAKPQAAGAAGTAHVVAPKQLGERRPEGRGTDTTATRILAMDCEMVGVGTGNTSALAHVCIVNSFGNVVFESYAKPTDTITDYRTHVSGIKPSDLKDAPAFVDVQKKVADIIANRILVGHAIQNDLKALLLSHPRRLIRDTSLYRPLMQSAPRKGAMNPLARRGRSKKLRELAAAHLGLTIQDGAHSPAEDARAALLLYQRYAKEWEKSLKEKRYGKVAGSDDAAAMASHGGIASLGASAGGREGAAGAGGGASSSHLSPEERSRGGGAAAGTSGRRGGWGGEGQGGSADEVRDAAGVSAVSGGKKQRRSDGEANGHAAAGGGGDEGGIAPGKKKKKGLENKKKAGAAAAAGKKGGGGKGGYDDDGYDDPREENRRGGRGDGRMDAAALSDYAGLFTSE